MAQKGSTMMVRNAFSSFYMAIVCLVAAWVASCVPSDNDKTSLGSQIECSSETDATVRIQSLASKYLFQVDPSGVMTEAVLREVAGLSPRDARSFSCELKRLQLRNGVADIADSETLALSAEMDRLAKDQSINRFAYQNVLLEEAKSRVFERMISDGVHAASCSPGYASCNWTTYWPFTLPSASCTNCSSNGAWNDRMSNSPCEKIACDHRIAYSVGYSPTRIYGLAPAAQCVINYYAPNIIASYASGSAYALFGISGPAACGIVSSVGYYLQTYTGVY
jgi:hypothetical protein